MQNYTIFASVDGGEYKLVRTITNGATSYDFTDWFWGEVTFKIAAKSNNGWSRVRDALNPLTLTPTPVDVVIVDGNYEPPPGWEDPGVPPTTEPKTPFSLTAEAIEASKSIKLKWNDNSDDEKGFIIQR
ncbi:MAG: hypothetical protein H7144_01850, partial [Burkholderiales bacterium]|nr:hypothetical protein [Phycisphaerae bacterium]